MQEEWPLPTQKYLLHTVPFCVNFKDYGAIHQFFQTWRGHLLSRGWRQKPPWCLFSQPRNPLFESHDVPILLEGWMHPLRKPNTQSTRAFGTWRSFIEMAEGTELNPDITIAGKNHWEWFLSTLAQCGPRREEQNFSTNTVLQPLYWMWDPDPPRILFSSTFLSLISFVYIITEKPGAILLRVNHDPEIW